MPPFYDAVWNTAYVDWTTSSTGVPIDYRDDATTADPAHSTIFDQWNTSEIKWPPSKFDLLNLTKSVESARERQKALDQQWQKIIEGTEQ